MAHDADHLACCQDHHLADHRDHQDRQGRHRDVVHQDQGADRRVRDADHPCADHRDHQVHQKDADRDANREDLDDCQVPDADLDGNRQDADR